MSELSCDLHDVISEFPSIELVQSIETFDGLHGVAFIGSSASGKTTLVNALRGDTSLSVLKRYITRPPRLRDDLRENYHISLEQFHLMEKEGKIGLSWKRFMEEGRIEHYGFEREKPGTLAIYSANNDFVRRATIGGRKILIVGVYAPDEIRENRLLLRSPDIAQAERAYRLGDSSLSILPYCHVKVNNYGEFESRTTKDIVGFVRTLKEVFRESWSLSC